MIPDVQIKEGSKGPWKIKKFTVSEEESKWSFMREGHRGVRAGNYTALYHKHELMMSDTNAEKADHRLFVHNANGNVLINGLGLAMVATACALKNMVQSVTVMEISQDLIDLITENNELHSKIKIVQGDALNYKWPKGTFFDCVWHDIWTNICVDNLKDMEKLHRKWGRRCHYQGSWCKELLQSMNKYRNPYRTGLLN